jgi:hypothetical protein
MNKELKKIKCTKTWRGRRSSANACVSWLLRFYIGSITLNGFHSGITNLRLATRMENQN